MNNDKTGFLYAADAKIVDTVLYSTEGHTAQTITKQYNGFLSGSVLSHGTGFSALTINGIICWYSAYGNKYSGNEYIDTFFLPFKAGDVISATPGGSGSTTYIGIFRVACIRTS